MDEACRLLIETDMLVRDVMEKVGYIDLASFRGNLSKFTALA